VDVDLTIFHQDSMTTLYQGHVLDVLGEMPSGSVQMVMTSPPYWGLRDYGIEPVVWGGDRDHQHEWNLSLPLPTKLGRDGNTETHKNPSVAATHSHTAAGQSCGCGAWKGSLGLEPTPELYLEHLVEIFREVRRVLRKDGTCWLNMGDSYFGDSPVRKSSHEQFDPGQQTVLKRSAGGTRRSAASVNGLKAKDLSMMPARLALALQADGWWIRQDITLCKRAPMPESVQDRPISATEHLFLLSKSARYYYDAIAVREGQRDLPSMSSPDFARATQPTIFSSAAIREELTFTLNTDNVTPKAGGSSLSLHSQDSVNFAMTFNADSFEIGKSVSGFVIVEQSEGDYMINLENGVLAGDPAVFTAIAVTLQNLQPDASPARPTIIKVTTTPSGAQLASLIRNSPFTGTLARAEIMRSGGRTIAQKPLTTVITFQFKELRASFTIRGTLCSTHNLIAPNHRSIASGHALRNWWVVSPEPFPDVHFAVFGSEYCEKPILAGTSAKGCCSECWAPWTRVLEKGLSAHDGKTATRYNTGRDTAGRLALLRQAARERGGEYINETRTTGWRPTCEHEAPVQPCVVLDPFCGAGTTGVVAKKLGRHFIGIDIKRAYLDMARARIEQITVSMKLEV